MEPRLTFKDSHLGAEYIAVNSEGDYIDTFIATIFACGDVLGIIRNLVDRCGSTKVKLGWFEHLIVRLSPGARDIQWVGRLGRMDKLSGVIDFFIFKDRKSTWRVYVRGYNTKPYFEKSIYVDLDSLLVLLRNQSGRFKG